MVSGVSKEHRERELLFLSRDGEQPFAIKGMVDRLIARAKAVNLDSEKANRMVL